MTTTTAIDRLADTYIETNAALDPIRATFGGVPGHETELTDYSPAGAMARNANDARTLAALRAATVESGNDRVAARLMDERLQLGVEMHEAREHLRAVRNIGSPVQSIRQVFDLMPKDAEHDWENIAARLRAVPEAIANLRAAYRAGMDDGLVAARRQAVEAAQQCAVWAGETDAEPFFAAMVAGRGEVPESLGTELDDAAAAATAGYAELARFLRDEYAPVADERDGVGRERYEFFARTWLGAQIDLDETYAWGWDELVRIEQDMARLADQILPGSTIGEAIQHLESESDLAIEGEDNLRGWLQDLMDHTIADLDGVHFDIPEPVRRVEAMIAPPGGAAAMYYTPPSEDFSRPGRTWYPTLGKTRFPLWGEVSIAYHEGVPGHHLQLGQVKYLHDQLNRFQRMSGVAGHAEGWALYAERLMHELGYLERPEYHLGMLRAQALRATRVIVDIGMHLELTIPAAQDFHPGERWTPALGQEFVDERSRFPRDFMASEIVRYLGWPGQAICYKVGERVWLDARADAEARHGDSFDLKAWHAFALDLGPLGLDQLRDELARF
jgi:uncharacterized protein (DUF885 family)